MRAASELAYKDLDHGTGSGATKAELCVAAAHCLVCGASIADRSAWHRRHIWGLCDRPREATIATSLHNIQAHSPPCIHSSCSAWCSQWPTGHRGA